MQVNRIKIYIKELKIQKLSRNIEFSSMKKGVLNMNKRGIIIPILDSGICNILLYLKKIYEFKFMRNLCDALPFQAYANYGTWSIDFDVYFLFI